MVLGSEFFKVKGQDSMEGLRNAGQELFNHPLYKAFTGIYKASEKLALKAWGKGIYNGVKRYPDDLSVGDVLFQEISMGSNLGGAHSEGLLVTSFTSNKERSTLFTDTKTKHDVNLTFPLFIVSPRLEIVTADGEKEKVKLEPRDFIIGLDVYDGKVFHLGIEADVVLARVVDVDLTADMQSNSNNFASIEKRLQEKGTIVDLGDFKKAQQKLEVILEKLKRYDGKSAYVEKALELLGLNKKSQENGVEPTYPNALEISNKLESSPLSSPIPGTGRVGDT